MTGGNKMFAVTIDGKAGCGKSTLADELSKQLNLKKFNTGAVYRGITCEYKKIYGDMEPELSQIENFVKNLNVEVVFEDFTQKVIVNGTDYTYKGIADMEINKGTETTEYKIKIRDDVKFFSISTTKERGLR